VARLEKRISHQDEKLQEDAALVISTNDSQKSSIRSKELVMADLVC
jgi:hypothetical protein